MKNSLIKPPSQKYFAHLQLLMTFVSCKYAFYQVNPACGTVFLKCFGGMVLKRIMKTLGLLAFIAGTVMDISGLPAGIGIAQAGCTCLAIIFIAGTIRIPKNSRGTPAEQANVSNKVRFLRVGDVRGYHITAVRPINKKLPAGSFTHSLK